ncbi:class I SAM-dependent methyltransferase [Alteromonas sp. BL110]|uniref:class I SAM-dependent DNA methyltransferase n=1 Tax=Alteromonas sp. BL110 TaxID=1714845 RepID=UPI000E4BD728|nr:class I SAM-dependent methyltransferase [Alteromonas sp. BL110]AXT38617.1 class I SAM-dependent methyltransferase [Alteromonas sp. BL110]RKM83233.1 methyltransferase domain-containing protein [Alteromonas sp. BL110]
MTPEETGKAYDTITHRWTRPEFNQKNGIIAYQKALSFLPQAPQPEQDKVHSKAPNKGEVLSERKTQEYGYALDIGCGCTNRFVPIIESNGLTYEGIDVSRDMLAIAKSQLPAHTFYCADVCTFTLTKHYSFISAWDSFWHIPLTQQEPLLKKLMNHLNDGGVLLFSCGGTYESGQHTNEVMGPEVYYASLGLHRYLEILMEAGGFIRHVEFDQHPEQHTIIIVQKRIEQK